MCIKHPYRLSALTGLAALLLLSCSDAAIASSDAHVSLIAAPKTMLVVHSGFWRGEGVITTNNHSIKHTLSFCIKHPRRYILWQTGAQLYGGYFPPTCKVHIAANTTDSLAFQEVCVPPKYLRTVINHSGRFSDLTDLPAYLFKRYEITSAHGGIIQVTLRKSEKMSSARHAAYSKGSHNDKSSDTTKYFSTDIHGTFRFVSSACPYPIKIPTNKELRAEGKSVKGNHDLSEKLKSRLGFDPFSHSK